MNILVTGGAGFIGSHLVEAFLADGHEVICIDNFDPFYDPAIKRKNILPALSSSRFKLVEGDVRDMGSLNECFAGPRIDTVVHLAARTGVRPSIAEPELYFDVNVLGTLRLLETMKRANVKKLLFASSSSVYGNNPSIPFSENDIVDNPISPYAATKKAGELLCHTFYHLYGFDVFCLRFFTVFDPRQRPDMAIHQFVRRIADGRPITLYGDGASRRDYTYVADIVQGVKAAINRGRGYEIINLGESRTTSLFDLIKLIEAELGQKSIIQWKPMQPGDVNTTCADIKKARSLLGYVPQYTMNAGIHLVCEWMKASS